MNKKINVCLVGVGNIGRAHLEMYQTISSECNVVCVDTNLINIPAEIKCFKNLDEACVLLDFDLIDICVPTNLHFYFIEKVINETRAQLLVEKPFLRTFEEFEKFKKIYKTNSERIIMCAMVERFFAPFVQMKDWCALQKHPLSFSFTRRTQKPNGWMEDAEQSGGVAFDLGIHDIDLFQWLTQSIIAKVRALEKTPDRAIMQLETQRGDIAKMHFAWDIKKNKTIFVVNEVDIVSQDEKISFHSMNNTLKINGKKQTINEERFPNAYMAEIKNAIASVKGLETPKISIEEIMCLQNSMSKIENNLNSFKG